MVQLQYRNSSHSPYTIVDITNRIAPSYWSKSIPLALSDFATMQYCTQNHSGFRNVNTVLAEAPTFDELVNLLHTDYPELLI